MYPSEWLKTFVSLEVHEALGAFGAFGMIEALEPFLLLEVFEALEVFFEAFLHCF